MEHYIYYIVSSVIQVELSKSSDGYLHIGDQVCLLHIPTRSVVSAHVTSARAFDATRLESGCEVTCSHQLSPCPRNVFVITKYVEESEVIHTCTYKTIVKISALQF